jgi:hypothetical protein
MKPELKRFIPGLLRKDSNNQTSKEIQSNLIGITQEVAETDIKNSMSFFKTVGKGTDKDRAAQLILESIQVASRRLERAALLKTLYIDNLDTAKMVPSIVSTTLNKILNEEINMSEGRKNLDKAIPEYQRAFKELGITPASSVIIALKSMKER